MLLMDTFQSNKANSFSYLTTHPSAPHSLKISIALIRFSLAFDETPFFLKILHKGHNPGLNCTSCRIDITIFILYLGLYWMEPFGAWCHISAGTICYYSSLAVTQPYQPWFFAWSALKKGILILKINTSPFLQSRSIWQVDNCPSNGRGFANNQ